MTKRILILGASYGSLLGTKCLMAGHDVTLVCRKATAAVINDAGTVVRLKLKGEEKHREIRSAGLPGRLDARSPDSVDVDGYDLVVLAMQEPQYVDHAIRTLMIRIAAEEIPCLSLMNMPPLPYLKRLPGLDTRELESAYTDPRVWDRFIPGLVTLCSPDPQAFRPADEAANVLHVGLPTNFKSARFESDEHTAMLYALAADIDAVRLDGHEVPVKLNVHESLFVPLAKWSMLLTGNYRCVLKSGSQSIRDAVHGDIDQSREIYTHVDAIARRLGAEVEHQVPFEKYARAAEALVKPSSAARAIASGAPYIERVDIVVQKIAKSFGMPHPVIDRTVATVDGELRGNRKTVA